MAEKGKDDAKKAGAFLKAISFDKIFVSDLYRAIETAETAIPNCCYEISALLREIDVGILANTPLSIITDEQRARTAKYGYEDFGGETKEHFQNRVSQVMKKLEVLDCKTVALFSHAGWLRGMIDTVIGTYLPRENVCCNNCTIAIIEYTNQTWRLHSWVNLI